MSGEFEVLKLVCHRLEQEAIPYMLTGSFAANFYAVPRMTRDIDIVIEIQKADADRLFQIFQKDFYVSRSSIDEAIEHKGMFNIIHNDFVFKVDFIIRKDSTYRNTEFQRKRQVFLDMAFIWIVAPEDLIISKLSWAKDSSSEMQLKDVKNLLLTLRDLDKEYLHSWVQTLKLDHVYQKVNFDE
jgi:hypothetical protein